MPELPDIVVYTESLQARLIGSELRDARAVSPFVLRSVEPAIAELVGRKTRRIGRLGKQLVFDFGDDLFAVIHLLIAGRFRWLEPRKNSPAKITLAEFRFDHGTLALTETASKKRASIHIIAGVEALREFDREGLELLPTAETHVFPLRENDSAPKLIESEFSSRLESGNHTLKRALTSPRNFSGIGNAYSDEILHAARLSPVLLTSKLTPEQTASLYRATVTTLTTAISRLRAHFAGKFPGPSEITAFRPEFAVHGKYGKPCLVCATPVQRIRYAENETNYCPTCQTGGKVLADRSLSRLLRDDWPRTIEELERPK